MNIFKIIKQFSTQQSCLYCLAQKRLGNKPVCMLKRKSKVKTEYVKDTTAKTLLSHIYNSIETDSLPITDKAKQYQSIDNSYVHRTVKQSNLEFLKNWIYKNKEISFNASYIEDLWYLIKRELIGQFYHIYKKYLQK